MQKSTRILSVQLRELLQPHSQRLDQEAGQLACKSAPFVPALDLTSNTMDAICVLFLQLYIIVEGLLHIEF